ncbi:TRM11 family SAM-dependent methyltransferase [Microlunatus parietis]|uniref:Methyltransferase domain-containing protein n=1 Tax=Microlunatus parietis TaxID=682979 RepID=A0A7Y9IAL2_9ACTN|nr:site-specific DNA-methyltransferase [Microlunatus parietis]NYE73041.1 hypothetical protein [Microlunatus parietis]
MTEYVILLAPSANRVYADQAARLVGAELAILLHQDAALDRVTLAGVEYLAVRVADPAELAPLGFGSATLALYRKDDDHLLPVRLDRPDEFDDDLVTIPKYSGKTNEQFTRLLINVTLAARPAARADRPRRPSILDPLCGRGTTLSTGLTLGYDVNGVELDPAAFEAYAAFLRTYLRRKRIKHTLTVNPVRRDGRHLGSRLEATIAPRPDRQFKITVFTGDTRQSAALYGQRRFDAVITDAPYGVAHGSHGAGRKASGRDRSAANLLAEAVPVWAEQLRPGGALGVAWNTYGLSRTDFASIATRAGLIMVDGGPYAELGHRVDSSINRDILVAIKPQ